MDTYHILLLNFDTSLQDVAAFFLKKPGYITVLTNSFAEAIQQVSTGTYDLLVLNLGGFGEDSEEVEFLRGACQLSSHCVTAVLANEKSFDLALQLFRMGVQDYILKCEGTEAILNRLTLILNQVNVKKQRLVYISQAQNLLVQLQENFLATSKGNGKPSTAALTYRDDGRYLKRGKFIVDLSTRQVCYKEKTAFLTQGTFNYFVVLLRHAPNPVQHQSLVFEAQGQEVVTEEALGIAKWHIHQLRSTFKGIFNEDPIETIRGTGYRIRMVQE